MAYASGKRAYGISDRSGRRYRLRDMRKEWTGSLVGPDEFEAKHPQLLPLKPFPDPQALRNPRPDQVESKSKVLLSKLNQCGFKNTSVINLFNGIVSIHKGFKIL